MNNLINKKKMSAIIVFNVIFYFPLIILSPGFISDDYIIFNIISKNSHIPISLNPNEVFFLFIRPISYFSFWLDYQLWETNALPMVLFSMLLHLIVVTLFYSLIIKVCNLLKIKANQTILFFLLIIFSFHSDIQIWVLWISNRTELLFMLFYMFCLYFMVRYIISNRLIDIIFVIVFYCLSVLSKQTGLHLPLLFLFLFFLNGKYKKVELLDRKILIYFLFFSLLVISFFLIINILLFEGSDGFLKNIWKKPFQILGVLVLVVTPIYNQTIYNYFVSNKSLAIMIIGFFSFILFYFRKKISWESVFVFFGFFLIISFPRLFAAGGQRINTIYVFWLLFWLFFLLNSISFNKIRYVFFLAIIGFYFCCASIKAKNLMILLNDNVRQYKSYESIVSSENSKSFYTLVTVTGFEGVFINLEFYFYKKNKFGELLNHKQSKIFVFKEFQDRDFSVKNRKCLNVSLNQRIVKIQLFEKQYILVNESFKQNSCIVLYTKPSPSGRGFSEITYELPKDLDLSKTKLIYFDGKDWQAAN